MLRFLIEIGTWEENLLFMRKERLEESFTDIYNAVKSNESKTWPPPQKLIIQKWDNLFALESIRNILKPIRVFLHEFYDRFIRHFILYLTSSGWHQAEKPRWLNWLDSVSLFKAQTK